MFINVINGGVDDVVAALLSFGVPHLDRDGQSVSKIRLYLFGRDIRVKRRKVVCDLLRINAGLFQSKLDIDSYAYQKIVAEEDRVNARFKALEIIVCKSLDFSCCTRLYKIADDHGIELAGIYLAHLVLIRNILFGVELF